MYIPNRPRSPFLRPYQPPTGLSAERAHASTVPSFAGFCSSALPSSTQSPRSLEHRVQVVDRACVVEKGRLADDADDHLRPVPLVEVHLVVGGERWRLQAPGIFLRAGVAHPMLLSIVTR